MKYAVISDTHGNLPALEAVLQEVEGVVGGYIFLGDYCCDFPWYDEIIDVIRALPETYVVRGNKEDYFENLMRQDRATWIDGQMSALYYMMEAMSPNSIEYLRALPQELKITTEEGGYFHAFHASQSLFGETLTHIRSTRFHRLLKANGPGFDVIGALKEGLEEDPALKKQLDGLPDGLYLFGHNHLQWSGRYHGKLLLNPGACGLPLDNTKAASYAVVEYRDGVWHGQLRHAEYDMRAVADVTRASGLYKAATPWCEVMLCELLYNREYIHFFLQHVKAYAESIGDTVRPYSRETWNAAFACWDREAT